jgi:hypothetical protein
LEGREPHAQAVMSLLAGVDISQETRRIVVGSENQGTAGAGIHKQVDRGRIYAGNETHSSPFFQSGNFRRRHS